MPGGVPMLLAFHSYDPGDLEPGATDQSGYAFRTSTSVTTEAHPYTWGITDLEIPAGEVFESRAPSRRWFELTDAKGPAGRVELVLNAVHDPKLALATPESLLDVVPRCGQQPGLQYRPTIFLTKVSCIYAGFFV